MAADFWQGHVDGKPWTLSEVANLRERMDIDTRLWLIEQEHKHRAEFGDAVYEAITGCRPFDPDGTDRL